MSQRLGELTVEAFLEEVASERPAPGGGTAAAVAGALAAALVAMVARLSLGQETAAECALRLEQAEEHRRRLLALAQADAEAYLGVLDAYRLSRDTPEAKVRRREAVEAALGRAAEVPLEVAGVAAEVLAAAEHMVEAGYRPAATDARVAAGLARAAVGGALANVEVNLESMRDARIRESLRARAQVLAGRCGLGPGAPPLPRE